MSCIGRRILLPSVPPGKSHLKVSSLPFFLIQEAILLLWVDSQWVVFNGALGMLWALFGDWFIVTSCISVRRHPFAFSKGSGPTCKGWASEDGFFWGVILMFDLAGACRGCPGGEVPLGEGWSLRPVGTKRLPGPGYLLWWDPPRLGSPRGPSTSPRASRVPGLVGANTKERNCRWRSDSQEDAADRHVGSLQVWGLLLLPAEDHSPRRGGSGPRRQQLLKMLSAERVGRSSLGLLGALEAKFQMGPEPTGLSICKLTAPQWEEQSWGWEWREAPLATGRQKQGSPGRQVSPLLRKSKGSCLCCASQCPRPSGVEGGLRRGGLSSFCSQGYLTSTS